ncbi:hypothetical protein F2P56_014156 [Juglans regia]|uniref:Disease resistance N-terminal domain-containing protein n=2 Tax=Juglans regia TaxID=51240 RepID=A0A834CRZ6_JUGRE|nr:putative disease resistance protein At1g50180 [Juglans regia]KAF5464045.1 hypothetical protein F2P56_014156 [Juglans regia]
MAEEIVSVVVGRVGDLLIQKAISLHGVSDQVEQLQDELKLIRSLLKDADGRQNERDSVRKWVADIRNVAYDAEDIIERKILEKAKLENFLKVININDESNEEIEAPIGEV